MSVLEIPHSVAVSFGGEEALRTAVSSFQKALVNHAETIGEPAPTAPHIVEEIVKKNNGLFTVQLEEPDSTLNPQLDLRSVGEAVTDALNLVKSKHAIVLKDLSGNATVEERDTWPLQKEWAIKYKASQGEHEKNLILGLMTQAEIATHGDDAAQVMTEKIIAKSSAMDLLTSKAGGLKRAAEETLKSVTDKDQIPLILDSLEEKMSQAIIEFKAETGGE